MHNKRNDNKCKHHVCATPLDVLKCRSLSNLPNETSNTPDFVAISTSCILSGVMSVLS